MRLRFLSLLLTTTFLAGCAVPYIGGPSATLLARNPDVSSRYEPIGERIERSECFHWILFLVISGVPAPSHEALIARTLDEFDADALLDTQLTTGGGGIPLLYLQQCVKLEGTPARLRAEQAAMPTADVGSEG